MRTKVWNEHVKLVATLLNAMSIGVLGVAVIGPMAQPDNPFYGVSWDLVEPEKLANIAHQDKINALNDFLTTLPWYKVVEVKALLVALGLHVFAHIVLRAHRDE